MIKFSEEEEKQIFGAAGRTWGYVASDARELGVSTPKDAVEMVVDASRILDIGKLDKGLYDRLMAHPYKDLQKYFVKNRNRWY